MDYRELSDDHPYSRLYKYHRIRRFILASIFIGVIFILKIQLKIDVLTEFKNLVFNGLVYLNKGIGDGPAYEEYDLDISYVIFYIGVYISIGIGCLMFVFRFSNIIMKLWWGFLVSFFNFFIFIFHYTSYNIFKDMDIWMMLFAIIAWPLILIYLNGIFFYFYFILLRNVFNYFYNIVFPSGINLKKSFQGVDLSYVDLSCNYFLRGADLEDANLTGCNLDGVDFRDANLKNANLQNIKSTDLKFGYTAFDKLPLMLFPITRIYYKYWSGMTLFRSIDSDFDTELDLTGINLSDNNLTNTNLTNTNLTGANLTNTNLTGANLSFINLTNANLTNTNLTNSRLDRVNFNEGLLIGTNFQNASFSDCKLNEAILQRVSFINSIYITGWNTFPKNLQGINFRGAKFSNVDFQQADLSGADFQQANLSGSNLQEANLSDADFQQANLTDANLRNTNFSGANLKGANVTRAMISGSYPFEICLKDTTGIPVD